MSPVALSLVVALLATLVAAPPALVVGAWLARTQSPLKLPVQAASLAPLVLPPIVTGWALLVLFGARGPLSALPVAFTPAAAVLASATVGFPLFVRAVQLGFEGVDAGLEDAARVLGAPPGQVLRRVTLPLALPGILTGASLCFARALGEFGATILFAGNIDGSTRTLPLALFTALQTPGGESLAARYALVSVALSLVALGASELLRRRLIRWQA